MAKTKKKKMHEMNADELMLAAMNANSQAESKLYLAMHEAKFGKKKKPAKKKKEIELKGKFVVAHDTLCDGWNCMMHGEEGDDDYGPLLFDSEDEAYKEIFDGNASMLDSHRRDKQLREYNPGVTGKMIDEMWKLLKADNVQGMRDFMDKHPDCDDSGEWVEPAETFVMNRKVFFNGEGIVIEGTKLKLK